MTTRFKQATEELHKEVEAENLARFIMEHSMERPTYELLLLQNYAAYKSTETAICGWISGYQVSKYQLIGKDLDTLGIERPTVGFDFDCTSSAEAYGAAYVVEGSALGGLVLAKHIKKCPALSGIENHHFFNGDKENIDQWKTFKERLEAQDFSENEIQEAIEKAKDTFRFFQKIFRMEREAFSKTSCHSL